MAGEATVTGIRVMTSKIIKRSVTVGPRKTSISLEQEFWDGIKEIADLKKLKLGSLIEEIHDSRGASNLSSAIRVFVYNWFARR